MTRTTDPRLNALLSELRTFLGTPGALIGVNWSTPAGTLSGNYDQIRPAFHAPELHLTRGQTGTTDAHALRVPLTSFSDVTRHAADAEHPMIRYHLRSAGGATGTHLHLVLLDAVTLRRHTCPNCRSLFTLEHDQHEFTREVDFSVLHCRACGEDFTPAAEPASMRGANTARPNSTHAP
ncbi:hypothetical protein [Deinococcus soli (ex Cha et al. 2016)]|uniref:Uncharacterized protein n=2 Tax=Deinococcus soli (ex Cha et al. 2016) TaxID=1309411 RepID=A0AAE3XD99_9DEIO|nr:hypothetical protein [Deinococcus soli (ex Cha et al. 2016)]MDR6218911.1 hypothetical protein [Deinococcus soli (ex Cha et al. 2016)]MDR6328708.1 hypothetical protein [Deinococcus soli (ex Cha et al. 2016)]MDR6751805.1 hypothetical protein [Deinococcus soli (ex Cha et al. 2016)]